MGRQWYGEGAPFVEATIGGAMLRSYLAEAAGAGTRLADAAEGEWFGGGSHPGADGVADGHPFDVKRAWTHRSNVVGFGGPGRQGRFGTDVDEVVLVLLDEVVTAFEWHEDGQVDLTARARPASVYLVPTPAINGAMRRDGRSKARWLVDAVDLAAYRVR